MREIEEKDEFSIVMVMFIRMILNEKDKYYTILWVFRMV